MAPSKKTKSSAAERFAPPAKDRSATPKREQPPRRYGLLVLFLLISVGGTFLAITLRPAGPVPQYKAVVIPDKSFPDGLRRYPHDPQAFTQGLVWEDGVLWESTGQLGQSSIRKVDLNTGKVLINKSLKDEYFGEGLALLNDKFYQQTWKNEKVLVYDRELNQIDEFEMEGEGWGLTTDGVHLIFSDGSNQIRFIDPETFETVRSISVIQSGRRRIVSLNELEYIEGKIYANRWKTETIYEINPDTGAVTQTISLAGLWPVKNRPSGGVMNGIAFNAETKKMLVTGKYCPYVFEVDLVPVK